MKLMILDVGMMRFERWCMRQGGGVYILIGFIDCDMLCVLSHSPSRGCLIARSELTKTTETKQMKCVNTVDR
jgi:hypothetical protein